MTTATPSVEIHCDTTDLQDLLKESAALYAQSPDWLRWLYRELLEHLEHGVELVRVDLERQATTPANQIRVLAQPTDKLVLLLAAMRAGNGQGSSGIDFEFEHE